MKLKPEDAELFYELFLPLLDYVNENFHVTTEKTRFTGESINPQDAYKVANFLWTQVGIIDDYLKGMKLPNEHMKIIQKWKRCIPGTFILERYLKKGSVFISVSTEDVYLVNGIISSWDEMLHGVPTPIILKATLLPFRDVIITDGLVSVSQIRFGRNYSADFKKTYTTAKHNGSIKSTI